MERPYEERIVFPGHVSEPRAAHVIAPPVKQHHAQPDIMGWQVIVDSIPDVQEPAIAYPNTWDYYNPVMFQQLFYDPSPNALRYLGNPRLQ